MSSERPTGPEHNPQTSPLRPPIEWYQPANPSHLPTRPRPDANLRVDVTSLGGWAWSMRLHDDQAVVNRSWVDLGPRWLIDWQARRAIRRELRRRRLGSHTVTL